MIYVLKQWVFQVFLAEDKPRPEGGAELVKDYTCDEEELSKSAGCKDKQYVP